MIWAAEGRGEAEWGRTASLMAQARNFQRVSRGEKVWVPDDFNPYRKKRSVSAGIPITPANIRILKHVFVNPK